MEYRIEESKFKTYTVPGVQTGVDPILVAYATDRTMRVIVDNVGATVLRFATSSSSLEGGSSAGSDHYQLNGNQSRVYVLAPKQRLFAVSVGGTGQVSIHTSDAALLALPFQG